jgi:hypothetical protein
MNRKNRDRRGGHQQQAVWLPLTFGEALAPAPSSRSMRTRWKKAERKAARRQHKRLTEGLLMETMFYDDQDRRSEDYWCCFLGRDSSDAWEFETWDDKVLEEDPWQKDSVFDVWDHFEQVRTPYCLINERHVGMTLSDVASAAGYALFRFADVPF